MDINNYSIGFKMESIQDLINSIKDNEQVDIEWHLNHGSLGSNKVIDEAITAFALRFLQSNLDDEEVAEALYDSLQ